MTVVICTFLGFVGGFMVASVLAVRAAVRLRASHRISCSDPNLAARLHQAGIDVEVI